MTNIDYDNMTTDDHIYLIVESMNKGDYKQAVAQFQCAIREYCSVNALLIGIHDKRDDIASFVKLVELALKSQ